MLSGSRLGVRDSAAGVGEGRLGGAAGMRVLVLKDKRARGKKRQIDWWWLWLNLERISVVKEC